MALVKIAADKRHLVNPRGAPFFVLGVNYAGYFDRAWQMWEPDKFSPELIARDFKKAQGSGFNVIRLFVHTALQKQLQQNDFSRLDHVLSMAQDHQLLVLLSLNDSHSLNLAQTAAIDAKIATRYKDVPTMLGYDLENEPVFYNLAAAIYPANYPAPLHSRQLVDHYGERVSRAEAASLQQQRKIPAHLNPEQAYFYINALRLFLEYDAAVNAFVGQGKGTLVDFMRAAPAERWQPLITVLDGTVQAWLRARLDPLRAAGCQQLLTVGWNWLHFAGLPANRLLDFQSYHNYGSLNRPGFAANIAHLESLTGAFPNHPILFTEFGWSNHSSTNPAGSRPVDPHLTALYESATYAYLRANDFGGGFKWMLNDVQITHNPYEASFGLFSVGDRPKPVRDVLNRVSQEWPAVDQAARFKSRQDFDNHLAYRFDAPGQITLGGRTYQDDALHWQGQGPAHCFLKVVNGEVWVDALSAGRLAVMPWQIIPGWNRARETNLFRVLPGLPRTRQQVFGAGQAVEFDMQAGVQYALVMGAQIPTTTPPPDTPPVDPQPGEHVLLLANADEYLPAALKYIRRFSPDFTFTAAEVAGRWAYVTVVAPPEVVPETTIDAIRGAGVQLIERVVGSTPAETRARLDEMARLGQRFVSVAAPAPPQTEPPSAPGPDQPAPPPTPAPPQSYTVKPGDTLSKIAQVVYGDFRLWPLIFEANRDQVVNPGLIRVGMVLHIPARN